MHLGPGRPPRRAAAGPVRSGWGAAQPPEQCGRAKAQAALGRRTRPGRRFPVRRRARRPTRRWTCDRAITTSRRRPYNSSGTSRHEPSGPTNLARAGGQRRFLVRPAGARGQVWRTKFGRACHYLFGIFDRFRSLPIWRPGGARRCPARRFACRAGPRPRSRLTRSPPSWRARAHIRHVERWPDRVCGPPGCWIIWASCAVRSVGIQIMFGTICHGMGGSQTVEDLFAADRVLNAAAPYAILASPLAGPVVPQGQRKFLKLVGFFRGNAASS